MCARATTLKPRRKRPEGPTSRGVGGRNEERLCAEFLGLDIIGAQAVVQKVLPQVRKWMDTCPRGPEGRRVVEGIRA